MENFTSEELEKALKIISSVISRCEKMQPKFEDGTSQHTLLKNRIKAMFIARSLINGEDVIDKYSGEELKKALPPIASINAKCKKAQLKFEKGTTRYNYFENMISAMDISSVLIRDEISKIG